jgi:hypothetical protein
LRVLNQSTCLKVTRRKHRALFLDNPGVTDEYLGHYIRTQTNNDSNDGWRRTQPKEAPTE